jgi:hypothetical protein
MFCIHNNLKLCAKNETLLMFVYLSISNSDVSNLHSVTTLHIVIHQIIWLWTCSSSGIAEGTQGLRG